jgi:AraC family transcriptional regulator, regulatory protein of adaptative response / DNA-3-methyladenine glycosylase II
MNKDANFYEVVKSRDPRFDGRVYTAVKTTKIYCRPVCPARPLQKNIIYYRSKAEAEANGFRPCLRCRPDLNPSSPQWRGTTGSVYRALRLISEQPSDLISIEILAKSLGITSRHMRRLFQTHLGASPNDIMISNRLHLARLMLSQTTLPITEIAFASGFQSVRRFNDAFKKRYQNNPRKFRTTHCRQVGEEDILEFKISYIPPYDWKTILNVFKRHPIYGCEKIDDQSYQRFLEINGRQVKIQVENDELQHTLNIKVSNAKAMDIPSIIDRIKFMFDIHFSPYSIPKSKMQKEGIRIPSGFDGFETAVAVILGQLVSVEQGSKNLQKLVEATGKKVESKFDGFTHSFPTPEVLSKSDLSKLGFTKVRQQAIKTLAQKVVDKEIVFNGVTDLSAMRESLLSIKGIGPWTVEMIALRCLGDTDAFPAKDLIIMRALKKQKIRIEKWSLWKSYLSLWIWKHYAHVYTNKKGNKNELLS